MSLIEKRVNKDEDVDLELDNHALGATPYKGAAQRQDMIDDIKEKANKTKKVKTTNDTDDDDDEEGTWQERYAKLRSWSNSKVNKLINDNKELAGKIETLEQKTGQEVTLPENDQELEEFAKQYPSLVSAMEKIITRKTAPVTSSNNDLQKQLKQLEVERTEVKILRKHPDWDDLKVDPTFLDWLDDQPQLVQNSIYKNTNDPESAIFVLDTFKETSGLYKAGKKRGRPRKQEVEEIIEDEEEEEVSTNLVQTRNNNPDKPRSKGGKKVWRESDVATMNRREYEKYEDDIDQAMKEGRFEYDMSGGSTNMVM